MFVTQRQLERALGYAEERYERLNKFYWDLWYRHERLLKHLGLHEEKVPEKIELRTKEGPERGDS
jgi:hypothetical protein